MNTIDEIFNVAKNSVTGIFAQIRADKAKDHVLQPVCIGYTDKEEPFFCPLKMGSTEEEINSYNQLRINFSLQKVIGYAIVSEAWRTTIETVDGVNQPEVKHEIVSIVAANRDGVKRSMSAIITRDADGLPHLGDFTEETRPGARMTGTSICLLDNLPDPPPELMAMVNRIRETIEDNQRNGRRPDAGLSDLLPFGYGVRDPFDPNFGTDPHREVDPFSAQRAARGNDGVWVDNPSRTLN